MEEYLTITTFIRLYVIVLGLWAAIELWRAKNRRHAFWTTKMKDIWYAHFLYVDATVTANIELIHRQVHPTYSLAIVVVSLIWSIKGARSTEPYMKQDE